MTGIEAFKFCSEFVKFIRNLFEDSRRNQLVEEWNNYQTVYNFLQNYIFGNTIKKKESK